MAAESATGPEADLVFGERRDWGLGWTSATPARMQRASYALVDDGRVWLVDPVDGEGLAGRLGELGEIVGVIRLLDRHRRDTEALAARHGVPLHTNPLTGIPGSPFIFLGLTQRRFWKEVALWWPHREVLVVPEAVGTNPAMCAPGTRLGVHPALRLTPPRTLLHLDPLVLLPGHGTPLEGETVAGELHDAVGHSRREIPGWLASTVRGVARR